MPNTTAVAVSLTFDSSSSPAPYDFSTLAGQITYADGSDANCG